jgi:hypothetical protein
MATYEEKEAARRNKEWAKRKVWIKELPMRTLKLEDDRE